MLALTLATLFTAFAAPPDCQPQTVRTAPGVPVAVTTNCTGVAADPTVTVTKAPIGGTLSAFPGTYTPSPGFNGVDFFRYTVTSGGETSPETTVNLVVNSLPTCANGTATTQVNTPLKLVFPCTDPDGGTTLIRAEHGAHGTVDPTVGTTITYTPDADYVGPDEIRFVGMDGAFVTAERRLTITVSPKPVPTASPDPTPAATASPQPTASPTPAPPAADRTAPVVRIKVGKASVAKGAAFTLTADEAGTAKLTLATGKYTVSRTAKLASGATTVTLKLSAKARKALKAKRRVKATLTVVATDAAGNRATQKRAVTLKR